MNNITTQNLGEQKDETIRCTSQSDFVSDNNFTWCTNCGNYSIWGALRNALVAERLTPKNVLLVYDIGCNGNGADKINSYVFKGLHGRSIPFAAGASLANRKVKVIASIGDGGVMAEGIGHLVHAIRSNYNVTLLIHNNSNFALTTGQASPTTKEGSFVNSSPDGVSLEPINIMKFVLSLNPSFAARGYSGNQKHLSSLMQQAIKHNGFSIIEVLQVCPSYNHLNTIDWYNGRIYDVATDKKYDNRNLSMAIHACEDMEKHIATGLLYRKSLSKDYSQLQVSRKDSVTELVDEVKSLNIKSLLGSFK